MSEGYGFVWRNYFLYQDNDFILIARCAATDALSPPVPLQSLKFLLLPATNRAHEFLQQDVLFPALLTFPRG